MPAVQTAAGQADLARRHGYTSDALVRNTGIAIDPSGNVRLANNWKEVALLNNPGGNSIVAMVGAAGPLKTPLIGAPRSFDRRGHR